MKIKEVCVLTGLTERTVRFYVEKGLCTPRVTMQNGDKRYFQARVFGWPETIDGADPVVMASPTVEICSKVVKVAAT